MNLAALAAALAPFYHAALRAAYAAQWGTPGGDYRPRRGVCAVVAGRWRTVNDPYWPLHTAAHYAWYGPHPVYGPGLGDLFVAPADRTEPRGPAAFAIPDHEETSP